MIVPTSFHNKAVVVLGLGRSGLSAARALLEAGAKVFAWDDTEENREKALRKGIPLLDPYTFDANQIETLVLSPGIPHTFPSPHPLVEKAKTAGIRPISDIELLSITYPQAGYIGITGTNGKSTTTALIGHCLRAQAIPTEVGGNIGIPVCDLDPPEKEGFYVLELSSYQLELSPHFHPKVGILLNITPDHLERHGGMEGYVAAKKLIFEKSGAGDTALISLDDPYSQAIYEELKAKKSGPKLLPLSLHQPLSEGICVLEGILYERGKALIDLKDFQNLRGEHNWQNIAATYGALRSLNLPPEPLLNALGSFPGLAHRQQVIRRYQNVTFVNDSKGTNAEATEKALRTYQGSPLYLLLGGKAKAGGITSLAPYFPSITHVFLFGEAAPEFSETLTGQIPFTLFSTLEEATRAATRLALAQGLPQATVLLSPACASFDQFRDFEHRGEAFCDYVENIICSL